MDDSARASEGDNPFRRARLAAGLTQTEAAAKLEVRPATVVAWEQGSVPRGAMLARVAELYGVDAAVLTPPKPAAPPRPYGFWQGRLAQIVIHHRRVTAELEEFLAHGHEWEAPAGADPADVIHVPGGYLPGQRDVSAGDFTAEMSERAPPIVTPAARRPRRPQ